MKTAVLITPRPDDRRRSPPCATPAPTRPPTRAWLLREGMPSIQVITFQMIAPIRAREDHRGGDDVGVDDPLADRVGDGMAEEQEGDEVEEGGPDHRHLRAQHAGRDHGRDRIGGVVQAVQEIEQQGDADQGDDGEGDSRPSGVVDHDALDLVGDVLEPVEHPFDMAVDLAADEEVHRLLGAMRLEQRLEAGVVEPVGAGPRDGRSAR